MPENRVTGGTRTLSLAVAVLKTKGKASHRPLVYLDGGPGGDTLGRTFPRWTPTYGANLQDGRDIVFFDQRGVGISVPSLACPELTDLETRQSPPLPTAVSRAAALARCHDELVRTADLAAYNSAESAADVADLMQALGYRSYDLYGVSYGTRLALTVARDRPYNVHAIVLDSTVPPNADVPLTEAHTFQRVLDKMTADCNRQAACAKAYGNIRVMFDRVAGRLFLEPAVVAPAGTANSGPLDVVDGAAFVHAAFLSVYSTKAIATFPRTLAEIDDGMTAPLAQLVAHESDVIKGISEGMQISVFCNENFPLLDAAAARKATDGVDRELLVAGLGAVSVSALRSSQRFCDQWDHASPDPKEHEAVHSSIPALILSGEYDPVAPPAWANQAAETLPHSTVVSFPGTGHGVLAGRMECASGLIRSFLDDPGRAVHGDCAEALSAPQFALPDNVRALHQ